MRKSAQLAYSGPSGAADLAVTLALAGQKAGTQQTMAFWGVEPCPPDRLARCTKGGIPTQVFAKKHGSDWQGQKGLKTWMAEQSDADAFIVHYPASLLPLRRVFKGRQRPRIILVEHNSILMKRPHHWVLSALAFWLCDGVVYLTDSYREQTAKKLGPFFRRRKTTVIANGLDLDAYPKRSASPWRDGFKPFTIGMSGRMAAAKDYPTLLDAFALLCRQTKRRPMLQAAGVSVDDGDVHGEAPESPPLHLELAGDGPLRPHLEDLAGQLGIRDQVTFTGHMAHADLLKRMAGWDAFVLSTLGETQPLAIMEAMAIGLPCVATDVPGVREMVMHGKNGLLAAGSDASALSRALAEVVGNADLRKRLGEVGNREALNNFSSHSMWYNYNNFIDYLNNK